MPDPHEQPGKAAEPETRAVETPDEIESGNVLEDLLLQAEIFVQYGLKPRALERAERLARQFPGEEGRNQRLRSLYASLDFSPGSPSAPPRAEAEKLPEDVIVDGARVSEITRSIFRQGNVRALLSTAVNEIGRAWHASRCVAGLCSSGRPPTAAVEYFAPGLAQSNVKSIVLIITTLAAATSDGKPVAVEDVAVSQAFAALSPARNALDIRSLVALPLVEAEQTIGVIVLEQCGGRRRWRTHDVNVLKSLAEQVVVTAAHIRLRSMVRSLSLADERSGLLSRAGYLDCLLTECERAKKQNTALAVLLVEFGRQQARPQRHQQSDEALESFMQEAGRTLAGHVRQNDIAIRYDAATVAMILPDTRGRDSFAVLDKVRRTLVGIRLDGAPPAMVAGMAEAIVDEPMDAADSVTELINRAEAALEAARQEGGGVAKLLLRPDAEAAEPASEARP